MFQFRNYNSEIAEMPNFFIETNLLMLLSVAKIVLNFNRRRHRWNVVLFDPK